MRILLSAFFFSFFAKSANIVFLDFLCVYYIYGIKPLDMVQDKVSYLTVAEIDQWLPPFDII